MVNRYVAAIATVALAGSGLLAVSPAAVAVAGGGGWERAEQVPGTAAVSSAGSAGVEAVSCASAGNCSAGGGYYTGGSAINDAFVVSQVRGVWGTAQQVPGVAALNYGSSDAEVTSVSCTSAGNCGAAGYFTNSNANAQAFVVSQVHGVWGTAQQVNLRDYNLLGQESILAVSCAAAGDCTADGTYYNYSGQQRAFVVSQVRGRWGTAEPVPVPGRYSGNAAITSLSCAAVGSCSAAGSYYNDSGQQRAFVASESRGAWSRAQQIPGPDQDRGGSAWLSSVSCGSAGNCTAAGGADASRSGQAQSFAVSETHGVWGTAQNIPAPGRDSSGWISSVWCASAGNCTAAGRYAAGGAGQEQPFVVSQTHGSWGAPEQVAGAGPLSLPSYEPVWVSCGTAGGCSAAGSYTDSTGHQQVFVASETGGRWGRAEQIPGTAMLNKGGDAHVSALSCTPAGGCSAGGSYTAKPGNQQAFVVSRP